MHMFGEEAVQSTNCLNFHPIWFLTLKTGIRERGQIGTYWESCEKLLLSQPFLIKIVPTHCNVMYFQIL